MLTTVPAPPSPGTEDDRLAIVGCFGRAAFAEGAVCARLGIEDFDALEGPGRTAALAALASHDDLQALLVRLFVLGGPADRNAVGAACTPDELAAFELLGLIGALVSDSPSAPVVYSPVRLVPLADGSARPRTLFVASDRSDTPDGSPLIPFSDIVFSGHNPLTRQFLRLIPDTPAGSILELCAGTAIGALVAASTAERVTAVDITPRCTEFARFNCWINGASGVDVRQGDLYEPVRGERFNRILAHPPYVPALADSLIYRDGGESGDRLLRLIVEGLPEHLDVGGTAHLLSIGMDTGAGSFERRVREWLGQAQGEFDVVFAFGSSMAPDEFARSLVTRAAGSRAGDYDRWLDVFARREVREVVYGALAIRRFDPLAGEPQTRRVVAGPRTGPAGFEWLFRWFDWLRLPGRVERVLAARPALAAGCRLDVTHGVRDGSFEPQAFRLSNDDAAFRVHLDTQAWVVAALAAFDGRLTAAEVYDRAASAGSLPRELSREQFADLVCVLVERGFLSSEPGGG